MAPQRIQLSRRKGWRKPDGVIVVSRPTRWGNPFPIVDGDRDTAVAQYREWIDGTEQDKRRPSAASIRGLAGRDLACWCPLDQACHADVLIELANRMNGRGVIDKMLDAAAEDISALFSSRAVNYG